MIYSGPSENMEVALGVFRNMYSLRWPSPHFMRDGCPRDGHRKALTALHIMEFIYKDPERQVDGRKGPHYSNGQFFDDAAYNFVNAVQGWDDMISEWEEAARVKANHR